MPIPLAPVDAKKAIFAGSTVLMFTLVAALTGATAAIGTTITATGHGMVDKQAVTYVSGTGFTGLTAGTVYYVSYIDANTFKLAATPGGTAINITAAGSAGVFQPQAVMVSKSIDHDLDQKMEDLKAPDDKGILRVIGTVVVEQGESFKFQLLEAKRLIELFPSSATVGAGNLAGYLPDKTVQIWTKDPRDASGKVCLKSEPFTCTLVREGGLKLGDGKWSEVNMKVISQKAGLIDFTPDATA